MSRFVKLVACFIEDSQLLEYDLYINPFQIESFSESQVLTADGEQVDSIETVRIRTKTGVDYEILSNVNEFIKLVE